MSQRFDSAWISGAHLFGNAGLGVLAENIPATGDSGAAFPYNDLSLPADNGKEICGRVTTWPSYMSLFVYEDGSFEASGADGSDYFEAQLIVDGAPSAVNIGYGAGIQRVNLLIGSSPVTITCNLGAASAVGYQATIAQPQTIDCTIGSASAVGYQASIVVDGATVIPCSLGQAAAVGYQASIVVPDPVVIACALGIAQAIGLQASIVGGGDFVRAPSGSGASLISAGTVRPVQSATARPSQLNTRRY